MRRSLTAAVFSMALASGALLSGTGAALAQGAPLRCAVDGTFAPHAFPTLQGGVQGFNIDLFREAARRMGRELTIDSASFSGLITERGRTEASEAGLKALYPDKL